MSRVLVLVIGLISFLQAQTIMWEKMIPFETAEDGPVGIDIAPNGDIMVACYTNGPNYSQWISGTDSLIHAPETKIITFDANGNLQSSENFGVLFNNGIKGVGYTDAGYTLIGNYATSNTNYVPSSALQIYLENDDRDTIRYNSEGMTIGYWFNQMKNSFYHKPISNLYYNDSFFKSSNGHDMLLDTGSQLIASKTFINFPDTLFIDNTEEFIYHFYINDFDQSLSNDIFISGSIYGMYLKSDYYYIVKFNSDRDVVWQTYYYGYDHPESQNPYYINCISATLDGGCIFGVWNDLNDNYDVDENENYLVKLNSEGNMEYSKSVGQKVEYIHRVGENEFIYKTEDSSVIAKVIDTGTELQEVWAHSFPNTGVIRPIENGFISAGIKDNNIYIIKAATGTGIEDTSVPSSTELRQNYPNPFNPSTEISYSLKNEGMVTLSVFNTKGELINSLVNEEKAAGNHTVNFNGEGLNSGIYFYRLSVDGNVTESKRMLLIK